jgi:hypothetical protein
MSGDGDIGRGEVPAGIRAERDAYAAARDLAVTNNYGAAVDVPVGSSVQAVRAVEELAAAVAKQWRREEGLRHLQDPYPIPVRWAAADPLLSDHAANIRRVPADEIDLDGTLGEAVDAFTAIPSRRLVVIGPPGGGKTVFTLRFTLDLLERRQPGDPVPVIIGLHTWNPVEQSLQGWMAQRLAAGYPALGIADESGRTIASELVSRQLIIPVLDGLDEIAGALRGEALRALNMSLDRDAPVIVTCREADYRQIVAESDVLTAAAVVELLPLDLDDLADYLPRATKPSASMIPGIATKWNSVLDRLRNDPDDPACRVLLEVLRTPLMTSLARSIYSDQAADPAVLLDGGFASRGEVEEHLLDGFVPAAFAGGAWRGLSPTDAGSWLGFLAWHLDRLGTQDFEWWRLEAAIPALVRWLAPALITWVAIGVAFGIFDGNPSAWLYGAGGAVGMAAGLAVAMAPVPPASQGKPARRKLADRRLRYALAVAVPVGSVAGFAFQANSVFLEGWAPQTQVLGVVSYLILGFGVGVSLGILVVDEMPAPTTTPLRLHGKFRTLSWRRHSGAGREARDNAVLGPGMGFFLALGLSFCVAQAIAVALSPAFPPGGSVVQAAKGSRYVDYANGLRYEISDTRGRSIVTTRKTPFYTGYVFGVGESMFATMGICTTYGINCQRHSPVMYALTGGNARIWANVLSDRDPNSLYEVSTEPGTGMQMESDWLSAPPAWWVIVIEFPLGLITVGVLLLPVGFVSGVLLWLAFPSDITQAISPVPTLRTDRNAAIFRGGALSLLALVVPMVIAIITGKTAGIGLTIGSARAVAGSIAIGLLTISLSTWLRFHVARAWLAASGRLPWRLLAWMEEAHRRGALRQAGASYQFRHARLQERLAFTQTRQG